MGDMNSCFEAKPTSAAPYPKTGQTYIFHVRDEFCSSHIYCCSRCQAFLALVVVLLKLSSSCHPKDFRAETARADRLNPCTVLPNADIFAILTQVGISKYKTLLQLKKSNAYSLYHRMCATQQPFQQFGASQARDPRSIS